MPITPLHYPVAYFVYKMKKELNLPGIIVGSMFPDFEIPLILLLAKNTYSSDRLVLHSFLGAATLGTVLSVLFTVSLYPILVKTVFHVKEELVKGEIGFSRNLVMSCLLGNLSHVILDFPTHRFNPLFWPFQTTTVSVIFSYQLSLLIHFVSAALCVMLLIHHRQNTWAELLIKQGTHAHN